jgi:hypothetical protein
VTKPYFKLKQNKTEQKTKDPTAIIQLLANMSSGTNFPVREKESDEGAKLGPVGDLVEVLGVWMPSGAREAYEANSGLRANGLGSASYGESFGKVLSLFPAIGPLPDHKYYVLPWVSEGFDCFASAKTTIHDYDFHGLGPGLDGTRIGEVLFRAHAWGHSCVAAVVGHAYSLTIPHDIRTVGEAVAYAQACKHTGTGTFFVMTITERGELVEHMGWYAGALPPTRKVGRIDDSVGVMVTAWPANMPHGKIDSMSAALECESEPQNVAGCCADVPDGKVYCPHCKFPVNPIDHDKRCRKPGGNSEEVARAAQLGDVLHRLDVLTALMHQDVPSSERTVKCSKYVEKEAQAAYMRSVDRHDESDRRLSTDFEAEYLFHRDDYLAKTFPSVPVSAYVRHTPDSLGMTASGLFVVPAEKFRVAGKNKRQIEQVRVAIRGKLAYWEEYDVGHSGKHAEIVAANMRTLKKQLAECGVAYRGASE